MARLMVRPAPCDTARSGATYNKYLGESFALFA